MALTLAVIFGCTPTAEQRYQRYLEEVADTTNMEFITPAEDSIEVVDDNMDAFDDGGSIYTIPEIPQERSVNMYGNNYEVEKMMMGKE